MSVIQTEGQLDNTPFLLSGTPIKTTTSVIKQIAGHVGDLKQFTLMAKIGEGGDAGKWLPFTDEAATDGTAIPQGIYVGADIAEASIQGGDISDVEILIGGNVMVAEEKLVIEAGKTLDTIIIVGTTDKRTVRDHLQDAAITPRPTIYINEYAS
jgi:hypothetical protein